MFILSRSPEKAPDKPSIVEVDFEKGNPVAVNGKRMSPAALLAELNRLGGEERDRKGGHRGKPVRGDEVPGGV